MDLSASMTPGPVASDFIHAVVDNACIQHSGAPGPEHNGAAFVGGFVPDDLERLAPLRQTRDRRAADAFALAVDYEFQMAGSYLYGGLIYGHFGHIMSEMIHRILTTRRHFRERTWIFVGLQRTLPLLGFHHLPSSFSRLRKKPGNTPLVGCIGRR